MEKIHGMPILGHCYHRTRLAPRIQKIFVATCDDEIFDYIESIGHVAMKRMAQFIKDFRSLLIGFYLHYIVYNAPNVTTLGREQLCRIYNKFQITDIWHLKFFMSEF